MLNSASCDTINMDFKSAGSCKGTTSSGYSLTGTDQMGGRHTRMETGADYSRMVLLPPRQQKENYLKLLLPDQNSLKVVNHRPDSELNVKQSSQVASISWHSI